MGASLGHGRSKLPEPAINVTPLVDVVLVLLIIFMVITPALADGEHIELPSIVNPDEKPKDMSPIEVTVARNGTVLVDKDRVERAQLADTLRKLRGQDEKRELLLKTDAGIPYKDFRETLAMLQGLGFRGVSLKVLERKKAGS
ncbi:MAG: biopolymer transporter ExbD [Polyangiaceae bacterium]|nr:biopolymer transporter ExbD [Polyangiaceae bacterium]